MKGHLGFKVMHDKVSFLRKREAMWRAESLVVCTNVAMLSTSYESSTLIAITLGGW